jgi:hypothetical protein
LSRVIKDMEDDVVPGAKALSRSRKLRLEAANCIAVAISVEETDFSADLIDEAVKLAQRARQIAGA